MAGVNGRDVRVAFATAATWGTAASVTKQINLKSLEGFDAKPGIVTDESFNQTFVGQGEVGDYAPSTPELRMDLRYDGAGPVLIAAACGSSSAPTVVSSQAASSLVAYQHVITQAGDLTKFFTFAADVGGQAGATYYVLELPSAKPKGFTISVGDNGKMQLSVPLVANKAVYNSAINTNSTVVSRPLSEDGYVFGQDAITEALDDGFAEFGVDLTFPQMTSANANSLLVAWPAGTHLKGDMDFLGNYINSTSRYEMKFEMPAIQITEWSAAVTGHAQIRPVAKGAMRQATTAPTGMAFTTPMRITIVNMNSANLLA